MCAFISIYNNYILETKFALNHMGDIYLQICCVRIHQGPLSERTFSEKDLFTKRSLQSHANRLIGCLLVALYAQIIHCILFYALFTYHFLLKQISAQLGVFWVPI